MFFYFFYFLLLLLLFRRVQGPYLYHLEVRLECQLFSFRYFVTDPPSVAMCSMLCAFCTCVLVVCVCCRGGLYNISQLTTSPLRFVKPLSVCCVPLSLSLSTSVAVSGGGPGTFSNSEGCVVRWRCRR